MLVTIGIPVYNAEKYLKIAIQSVINQIFTDFELIIIDDGSTDDSVKIIESFKDDRIIFIKDGLNKALPYRLNQITNLAKGKYIARMDADDVMDKDRIKKQLEILEKDQNIDVLGTNTYIIDKNNKVIGIRNKTKLNEIKKVNTFIHPTIMGKKEWFLNNLYDERAIRIEDLELWLRNSNNNFYQLNEPLFFYRELDQVVYKKHYKTINSTFYIVMKNIKQKKYNLAYQWIKIYFKSYFKTFIYYILFILKKENILLNKRFIKINDSNLQNYYNNLMYEK